MVGLDLIHFQNEISVQSVSDELFMKNMYPKVMLKKFFGTKKILLYLPKQTKAERFIRIVSI